MKKIFINALLYIVIFLMVVFLLLIILQPRQESYDLLFQGVYHSVDSWLYHKYDNGIVSTYGKVSEPVYDSACNGYKMLPKSIQDSFEQDGWKIIISAYPINTLVTAEDSMIAVAQHDTHIIYIYKDYAYEGVLLHEVGHYVDSTKGFVSSKIQDIRLRERSSLMDLETTLTNTDDAYEHNTENASEYFATAFAVYILMPDELYERCPDTYEYIKQAVSEEP